MTRPDMKHLLFFICFGCVLSACEVEVDRPLPEHTPQMVFQGFMTPGDSVRLYLSRSYGPLEQVQIRDLLVDDAAVRFWINGVEMSQVIYRDTLISSFQELRSGYYLGKDATIPPGSRIDVEATHPDFGTARAGTTLPTPARILKVETIQNAFRQVFGNDDTYTQSILRVSFEDPAGEPNFYRILNAFIIYRRPDQPNQLRSQGLSVYGPALASSDGGFEAVTLYATDETMDGQVVTADFLCEFPDAYSPIDQWQEVLVDSLFLEVEYANQDYGEFQEKLFLQSQSVGGGISITPPEPVELYDNVEGGYGSIGGYVVKSDTITD